MVTAKRVNNDSHLSGCNVITAWVEVKIGTDLSTAYPSVVEGFFEILQDQTSVIVFFKEMANYLNKIFKRKTNMKIRQTVSNQILQLIPQFWIFHQWMWLAVQFSFHRLFREIIIFKLPRVLWIEINNCLCSTPSTRPPQILKFVSERTTPRAGRPLK